MWNKQMTEKKKKKIILKVWGGERHPYGGGEGATLNFDLAAF